MNWLLGVAQPLQLVEAAGEWIRLTAFGRYLFNAASAPPPAPVFPQTLLVQPNAEILAYRQGLTPALIATLSRFARWKGLGPACTLELTAEQTYRGLESGLTLPMMMQLLARHSSRPIPPAVADLLQRWASKRERITVFASAVLVEFGSPAELDVAVNRGIVALRLTDRIGMTADGAEPALAQLRLIANRDYEARPQQCVSVGDDGVTLTVDAAAADLLLDAEIGRFAVPLPTDPQAAAPVPHDAGFAAPRRGVAFPGHIDGWFGDRTGQPLSSAGRLFLLGPQSEPPRLRPTTRGALRHARAGRWRDAVARIASADRRAARAHRCGGRGREPGDASRGVGGRGHSNRLTTHRMDPVAVSPRTSTIPTYTTTFPRVSFSRWPKVSTALAASPP